MKFNSHKTFYSISNTEKSLRHICSPTIFSEGTAPDVKYNCDEWNAIEIYARYIVSVLVLIAALVFGQALSVLADSVYAKTQS